MYLSISFTNKLIDNAHTNINYFKQMQHILRFICLIVLLVEDHYEIPLTFVFMNTLARIIDWMQNKE